MNVLSAISVIMTVINVFINWLPVYVLIIIFGGNKLPTDGAIAIATLIYILVFGFLLSLPGQWVLRWRYGARVPTMQERDLLDAVWQNAMQAFEAHNQTRPTLFGLHAQKPELLFPTSPTLTLTPWDPTPSSLPGACYPWPRKRSSALWPDMRLGISTMGTADSP
jgi:prepilin signal peptidase PulO-like enzyme (type II secretory pathway)